MSEKELEKIAGMLAKIAYELSDKEGIDEKLKEELLDFWREFDIYNHF